MTNVVQRNGVRIVAFNKSGHASIVNTFSCSAGKDPQRGERGLEVLRGTWDKAKDFPQPHVTITYFRHPLARVASVYNYFFTLAREEQMSKKFFGGLFPTLEPKDLQAKIGKTEFRKNLSAMGFTQTMSFQQFCNHLVHGRVNLSDDLHLRRQADSLRECGNEDSCTYYRRLEDIATVWPRMVDELKLDCTKKIAHFNNKKYTKWEVMFMGLTHLRAEVKKLYKEDFEIWNMLSCNETGETFPSVGHEAS